MWGGEAEEQLDRLHWARVLGTAGGRRQGAKSGWAVWRQPSFSAERWASPAGRETVGSRKGGRAWCDGWAAFRESLLVWLCSLVLWPLWYDLLFLSPPPLGQCFWPKGEGLLFSRGGGREIAKRLKS